MAGIVNFDDHPLTRERRSRQCDPIPNWDEPSLLAGDALRDIAFAVRALAGEPQVETPPDVLLRKAIERCERAATLVEG